MHLSRIKAKTHEDSSGCWIWDGSRSGAGYGQLTENRRYWSAHVYAFVCRHGPVAKGQVVRHLCHNRACCNPDHLVIGTPADNYADSRETHLAASIKKRSTWLIDGVKYATCREAVSKTGIAVATIVKYTKDGVFDMTAYLNGCKISKRGRGSKK